MKTWRFTLSKRDIQALLECTTQAALRPGLDGVGIMEENGVVIAAASDEHVMLALKLHAQVPKGGKLWIEDRELLELVKPERVGTVFEFEVDEDGNADVQIIRKNKPGEETTLVARVDYPFPNYFYTLRRFASSRKAPGSGAPVFNADILSCAQRAYRKLLEPPGAVPCWSTYGDTDPICASPYEEALLLAMPLGNGCKVLDAVPGWVKELK